MGCSRSERVWSQVRTPPVPLPAFTRHSHSCQGSGKYREEKNWQSPKIWRFDIFYSFRTEAESCRKQYQAGFFFFRALSNSLYFPEPFPSLFWVQGKRLQKLNKSYTAVITIILALKKVEQALLTRDAFSIYFASLFHLNLLFICISQNRTWIAFISVIFVQILTYFPCC